MLNLTPGETVQAITLAGGMLIVYTAIRTQLAVHGSKLSGIEASLQEMSKALSAIARHDERLSSLEKRVDRYETRENNCTNWRATA